MALNTVFLGAPGVGKGTMAKMLQEQTGLVHISTGDILRQHMAEDTELGRTARSYVDRGQLVPDQVVTDLVKDTLAGDAHVSETGFVLDGFPRTLQQGKLLDEALQELGVSLHSAVLFEADKELLIQRLAQRRICKSCGALYNNVFSPPRRTGRCDLCGAELYQRPDDQEDTVRERLEVFERETAPLIALYQQKDILLRVPGDLEVEANFSHLRNALNL